MKINIQQNLIANYHNKKINIYKNVEKNIL